MATTTTLYVGNLSFYTTEEQIYEVCGGGLLGPSPTHPPTIARSPEKLKKRIGRACRCFRGQAKFGGW